MRAGSMRTPCSLLAPARVGTGESGEPQFKAESVMDFFCRITAIGGTRAEIAGRLAPRATHSVAIRYNDRVQPGMALRFHDGRVFAIDAILDHRDKRGDPGDPKIDLELLCSEGVLDNA